MDLKALIYDQLGHFALADIPVLLFGMFMAALLGWLAGLIGKSGEGERRQMALMAAAISLAVALVRASLPLSVALVAMALVFRVRGGDTGWRSLAQPLVVLAIGVGCGANAALIVAVPALLLAILLRWANAARS